MKIGITYLRNNNTSAFLPLIFINGIGDDWHSLLHLNRHNNIFFKGESSRYTSISELFIYLQEVINKPVFVNGDWVFISHLYGLQGASATYPCPICTIQKKKIIDNDNTDTHHRVTDDDYKLSQSSSPHSAVTRLVIVPASNVVPLPLHILLGLSHYMLQAMEKIAGEEHFKSTMNSIKQVHEKPAGLSDLFTLNGNEINKWIKQQKGKQLISLLNDPIKINKINKMNEWMTQLQHHLLTNQPFTPVDIQSFNQLVIEMQTQWVDIVSHRRVPKLHMLTHCVEFAQRHNYLGRYSESRIENCHSLVNNLRENNHSNLGSNEKEKLRRCSVSIVESLL